MRRDVLIERDLVGLVPPPPPALPIARLVDDDAVDPRLERGLAAEVLDSAENGEEDFLREVKRFVAVAQEVQGELVDHAFVSGNELGAGAGSTGGTLMSPPPVPDPPPDAPGVFMTESADCAMTMASVSRLNSSC